MILLSILLLQTWWSSWSDTLKVLFAHKLVLFNTKSTFFDEVTKNSLKCNDYQGSFHLVHSSLKVVPVRPLIELISTWKKMHLKIIALLLIVLLLCNACLFWAAQLLWVECIGCPLVFLLRDVIWSKLETFSEVCHAILTIDRFWNGLILFLINFRFLLWCILLALNQATNLSRIDLVWYYVFFVDELLLLSPVKCLSLNFLLTAFMTVLYQFRLLFCRRRWVYLWMIFIKFHKIGVDQCTTDLRLYKCCIGVHRYSFLIHWYVHA